MSETKSRILLEAETLRRVLDRTNALVKPPLRYRTALELIGSEGVFFSPIPVPESQRGKLKECFRNAGTLALLFDPSRYVYVEGLTVISKELPLCIPHAWVYDLESKKALEVTWEEPGIEYLGIPFETEWLRAFIRVTETWGVLDNRALLLDEADPKRYFSKHFRDKGLLFGNDKV